MDDSENYGPIVDSLKEGGIDVEQEQAPVVQPIYQMIGDTKIPVSKSLGKIWKSRRDQAKHKVKHLGLTDAWDETIRYYNNDQSTNSPESGRDPRMSRSAAKGTQITDEHIETENIVFANVTALVPATYAKNPKVEITARDQSSDEKKQFATVAERVINSIFQTKAAPGINLKPKARKAVIMTSLTNVSYIEIGYTQREQGSEVAMEQIAELSQKLQDAKSPKEIEAIEGELMAMEEKVDVLRPSGPWAKFRRPHDVLRDPAGTLSDLSDHNWIMVYDYVPTAFLRAVYYKKKDDTDKDSEYESIFHPTHVLKADAGGEDGRDLTAELKTFTLIPDDEIEQKALGFTDSEAFEKAQYTKVIYVWDKVTRRVMLFNDKDWAWPIWVWDDPTKLARFFTIFPLEFYTDPESDYAKSEVMYYLDQQDAINEILSERRRAISWARKNLFYNTRQIKDSTLIDKYLTGGSEGAIGVDLPDGQKLTDHIYSVPPPSAQFMQLFDTKPYLEAVDRISSVSAVMRAAEFKTNTTNKAIESYQSNTQTRLDEKVDQVEEFIGEIGCGILEMCLQFMPAEQINELVGPNEAQVWASMTPMTPQQLRQNYSFTIVGGSALKPTSEAKKAEATSVGQILGQFGANSPAAILVALKMMEQAFDGIDITAEDWAMIRQSLEQQQQQEAAPPAGPQQGGPPAQGGDPAQGGEQSGQLEQMFDGLDPKMKMAIGQAAAKGVPIREVIKNIMQRAASEQGAK